MNNSFSKSMKKIKKIKQEHLLAFYDELLPPHQKQLLEQINSINFDEVLELYDNSMQNSATEKKSITPLEHLEKQDFSKEEIECYIQIAKEELKKNCFAVVTMAGGQGTRLGYKGPKGTYPLDLKPEKKSLFQIMCEDIKRTNEKYGITIPWYIMTSQENDLQTKFFFKSNNYFGYPENEIYFFTQSKLPIITIDRDFILQEPYLIKEASNGNGNVFMAMKEHNIIKDMEKKNIKWVSFGGIDNVLLKNIDPLLLGLAISKKYQVASKSIFKEAPLDNVAVYCRKNGKPSILDYDEIDLELSEQKDDKGKYLYREANILSHLMTFDAVKKASHVKLPYHRTFKKNTFVNSEGVKQVPDKPNTFKFENFIFDAFSHFDDMLLLRVDPNEEFAPIKDFRSKYNPDNAKDLYLAYWKQHENDK